MIKTVIQLKRFKQMLYSEYGIEQEIRYKTYSGKFLVCVINLKILDDTAIISEKLLNEKISFGT